MCGDRSGNDNVCACFCFSEFIVKYSVREYRANRRKNMLDAIRRLPRTVWLLGLISLVNDSASDMIYPLVPLYLTSVLMAGPKALGLIEGIAEAASSLLKLAAGVLVDRSRRVKSWVV